MHSMSRIGASLCNSGALFKNRKKVVFYFFLEILFWYDLCFILGLEIQMTDKLSDL